ncbi:hypothetical protein K7H20_13950 [Salipiger manganoxidans]|uniref:hypothetical protein n=1 Tax=Salipiger marinus TaxID=555512 RepID=UPI001E4109DC|nr:hypothetical protein [Salipiger manganoxidans]MCD1619169.1 hypothetical protein [Salipiger manganoxidans]
MLDHNTPPPAGHNNPPPFRAEAVDAHDKTAKAFAEGAGAWLDVAPISTEEAAAKANDFIAGARAAWRKCDEDRKADKKPHDDAGKAVQEAYRGPLEVLDKSAKRVQPLLTAYLEEQERKKREEDARKQREADEAKREADEAAAKAAARHDVVGETAAEEAAKRAADLQKEADRAAKAKVNATSATGGARAASLRTTWTAELTSLRLAFMTFGEHPDVRDLLIRLAEAKARSRDFDPATQQIPGFALHEKKVAR